MLPGDDKAARDALVARGLIKAETRSSHNENGKPVRGLWMSVTDDGRAWAEENLAAVLAKAFAAAPILQAWLTRLSAYISAHHHLSLKEVLGSHDSGSAKAESDQRAARLLPQSRRLVQVLRSTTRTYARAFGRPILNSPAAGSTPARCWPTCAKS